MQKVQRQQQQGEQPDVQTQTQAQTRSPQQLQSQPQNSSSSTRYQTRQAVKGKYPAYLARCNVEKENAWFEAVCPSLCAVQQKDSPQSASSSTAGQVTPASSSYVSGDLQIPTVSADVAADIAKYTNKVGGKPNPVKFRWKLYSMMHYENIGTINKRCKTIYHNENVTMFLPTLFLDHGHNKRDNDWNLQWSF